MAESTRRKALKDLALTLPAAWSAPVIQAVSLPAHGQTSLPCAETDTIEGESFTCEDATTCKRLFYELEGGCLVRTEIPCEDVVTQGMIQIAFLEQGSLGNLIVLDIKNEGEEEVEIQTCINADDTLENQIFLPLTISGTPYQASFTIGRIQDPPTVFVSDITVAPG